MRRILCLMLSLILCVSSVSLAANQTNEDLIVISSVFEEGGATWIPLREVFEKLGGEVQWDANTGNIFLSYRGVRLECELAPNSDPSRTTGHQGGFLVTNVQNREPLFLNPMSFSGYYCSKRGTTYILPLTMGYLLDYLDVLGIEDLENNRYTVDPTPLMTPAILICGGKRLDGTETVWYRDTATVEGFAATRFPLRAICEGLGGTVVWNAETGYIEITLGEKQLLCETYVDGAEYIRILDLSTGALLTATPGWVTAWRIERIDGRIYLKQDGAFSLLSRLKVSSRETLEPLTVAMAVRNQTCPACERENMFTEHFPDEVCPICNYEWESKNVHP